MRKLLALCLLGIGLLIPNKAQSTAITSAATGGLWADGATWTGGVAPVKGDTVTILAGSTVTVRSTFDIGTNVAGSTALTINGWLDFPYDIDSGTWNIRGRIHLNDGQTPRARFTIATSAVPVLSTNTLTFINEGGGAANFYLQMHAGTNAPILEWYGSIKSTNTLTCPLYAITTTGVTASSNSVILDRDIDAKVGQEFVVTPTEAVTQCDTMTVVGYDATVPSITFNRSFTYAHNVGAYIANVERNIIWKATTTTVYPFFYKEESFDTKAANCNFIISNVRFENLLSTNYSTLIQGWFGTFNSCVWYKCGMAKNNVTANVIYNSPIFYNGTSSFLAYSENSTGVQYNNGIFIQNTAPAAGAAIYATGGFGNWSNCIVTAAPVVSWLSNSTNMTFTNLRAQCIKNYMWYGTPTSASDLLIDSCTYRNVALSSSLGTNNPLIDYGGYYGSNFFVRAYNFKTSRNTIPDGIIANNIYQGGEIRCQNLQQTIDNSQVINIYGLITIETTTVRVSGNKGLKFDSWSTLNRGAEYMPIRFTVNCNTNDTILFRGYIQTSAGYGFAASSSPYVKVYTDNSGVVAYSTATTASKTSWELLTAGGTATSTGTVTVELAARLSAGCTAYWDDMRLYVNNNVYALGKDWVDGYPQASPVASTVDAENIWNANVLSYPTANTTGKYLFEIRKRVP